MGQINECGKTIETVPVLGLCDCCNEDKCSVTIIFTRTLGEDTEEIDLSQYVIQNGDKCNCTFWEIRGIRTNPPFGGYPRTYSSGKIIKGKDGECILQDLPCKFQNPLQLKDYTVTIELRVKCPEEDEEE